MRRYVYLWAAVGAMLAAACLRVGAQEQPTERTEPGHNPTPPPQPQRWYDIGGQATGIVQDLIPFHSPYEGRNSLHSRGETEVSHTYTLFLGARLTRTLEVYVDPEWALGNGLGGGTGLSGYANGDLIGQGATPYDPYLARFFLRWRVATGHSTRRSGEERIGRSQNVMGGTVPARRVVIQLGRMAVTDHFDANGYANNARTQFMNKSLANNLAYDFAQNVRGYSTGLIASWVNPDWALRFGTFQMPDTAGGRDLAGDFANNRGDQIEYDRNTQVLRQPKPPLTARLLVYRNAGRMGRYRDALAAPRAPGAPPDVTAVRRTGATKWGWGLNVEQALADGGNTGVFARLGWNDGQTESFAYAEADRTFTLGLQLSGATWGRSGDRLGLAMARNGLSAAHRAYLAAGGVGMNLGDGRLSYGEESVVELYYAYQVAKPLTLTVDYQGIDNPGCNRDRGPLSVLSFRVHAEF